MSDEASKPVTPQSAFVSHHELIELTGYKTHSAQARWLTENDFHFVTNVTGRPIVHRGHLAFKMGVPIADTEAIRGRPKLRLPDLSQQQDKNKKRES